jgi:hypothetical protein
MNTLTIDNRERHTLDAAIRFITALPCYHEDSSDSARLVTYEDDVRWLNLNSVKAGSKNDFDNELYMWTVL